MPYDHTKKKKKLADLKKIGSLWLKTSAEGKKYQSGIIGWAGEEEEVILKKTDKIFVFPNKHRAHENSPYYYIFIEEKEEDEVEEEEMPFGAQEHDDTPPGEGGGDDDDLQF
jgi:CRISPR/Cas system Type II protein with McrA/HNH and RuvC-like nuclease domain